MKQNKLNKIRDFLMSVMDISVRAKWEKGIDIFVDWAPHVKNVTIRVYLGGWKKGLDDKPDYENMLYVDKADTAKLNRVLCEVSSLVNNYEPVSELELAEANLEKKVDELNQAVAICKALKMEGKANADLF